MQAYATRVGDCDYPLGLFLLLLFLLKSTYIDLNIYFMTMIQKCPNAANMLPYITTMIYMELGLLLVINVLILLGASKEYSWQ